MVSVLKPDDSRSGALDDPRTRALVDSRARVADGVNTHLQTTCHFLF